jgi:metal-responsive CopG/Arc/MetJ family transcriptional regulator
MADANTTQPMDGEQTAEYHGSRIVSVRLDEELIRALDRTVRNTEATRSDLIREGVSHITEDAE